MVVADFHLPMEKRPMQELIADTIKQRARKAATYSISAGKEEPIQSAGEWDVFFERFSRPSLMKVLVRERKSMPAAVSIALLGANDVSRITTRI
ncbi:MAG: hypothetical protein IBX56_06745 [Methylomicrobium sp.]|nr:hypothetical protein [Methylomicrobium sp.]